MNLQNSIFTIIREIGQGGMATVYLAKHIELNRLVAVKVLNKESISDVEYIKRFFREARITSGLEHPNIIKVIESDFTDGEFYIITEFINGGDMNEIVNSAQLSLHQKLSIILKIISALDYAHKNGIVHRDIKPSNILLTKDYEPKLCDFGIATALWGQESRLTQTNELMGTMDYIAPEQKENSKNVDFRADIYSIGVILYKIITGRKPIGAFKRPKEINKKISIKLDSIIIKCLQPLPSDRYKSTNNLYIELKETIDNINKKLKGIDNINTSNNNGDKTLVDKNAFDKIIEKLQKGTLTEKLNSKSIFLKMAHISHKPKLIELLNNSEGMLKEMVIEAIGTLQIIEACDILIELLDDSYYNKFAAEALGKIGCEKAEDSLLNLLVSDREDAHIAIMPLGLIGSVRAVKLLRKYLQSKIDWIREEAVDAMGLINDESIYDYIENCANRDLNSTIRAKAKKILKRRK